MAAFRNESLTLIYFITKMHYTQSKAKFIVESSVHKNNQFNKRATNFITKMHYTQSKAKFIVESSVHKNNQFNKRATNFLRKKIN